MSRCWRREEIELGMVLTQDKIEGEPLLYKVVAICDEPTVVIAPLFERDGDEQEHYVISAENFSAFHQVKAADQAGSFGIVYGSAP